MAAAGFNPINFVSYQDPAKGIQLQQQLALAQQLMAQSDPGDINKLANPGGLVVPYSPLQGLSQAGSKIAGAYMQQQALGDALKAYQPQDPMANATNAAIGQEGGMGPATAPDVANNYQQQLGSMLQGGQGNSQPNMQEMYLNSMSPGMGKAAYETRMTGFKKAAETGNTPYVTPQGTYQMGSQLMGGNQPQSAPPLPPLLQQGISNMQGSPQLPPAMPNKGTMSPDQQAVTMKELYPDEAPAAPVVLKGAEDSASPMAADGKPLLPNLTSIPAPDPSGAPKYKPAITNTDVNQTKIFQEADNKSNSEINGALSSLQAEQFRIKELANIYKDVQAGTLTAQNPEFFNKMAAIGFKDDPKTIEDLGGIQAAMQNHVLQLVGQYKDTNNSMGDAPSRMFGGVINTLIDHGENPGNQAGGLHTVLAEALGAVNHHIDMVDGWNKVGGLGNRLADGLTKRPDDFIRDWSLNHSISDYSDIAKKQMPAFKGMAGNDGAAPTTKTIGGITYTKINGQWHQ